MIKILNSAQIRELDKITIKSQGITSLELMERAAEACVNHLLNIITTSHEYIYVVCGKGNNGGDGLAIARILYSKKVFPQINIIVIVIDENNSETRDFKENHESIKKIQNIELIHLNEENFKIIIDKKFNERKNALIVDAILGTGINRPVLGFTAEVINFLNSTLIPIISIDVPSGMFTDTKNNSSEGAIIQSELTLSFQQPKYSFLLSDNGKYCGEFIVLDIGLDREFILEAESKNLYIEKYDVASLLKKRTKFSHKGTFGHALLIGGSKGKCGAAVLAGKACLKSGAGLVTIHSPACNTIILQTSIPEAMVSEDTNPHYVSELPDMRNFNAIGFGPGLGTSEISKGILKLLFQKYNGKIVIDADGINLLSENKTLLAFLPPLTIITPHPKEFDRLTEKHDSDFERIETAKQIAYKYHLIIILKSAHTAIVTPNGKVFFNSTGNPGMAKGGSGDVLTGIITGLLARGYEPLESVIIGVFLHGYSADIAIEKMSEESLLASEIINQIATSFFQLENI